MRKSFFNVGYTKIIENANRMTREERLRKVGELSEPICQMRRDVYNARRSISDRKFYVNQTFRDVTADVLIGQMNVVETMQHLTRVLRDENATPVFGGTIAASVLAIPPMCPSHLDINIVSDGLSDEKLTDLISHYVCVGATEWSCNVEWPCNISIYAKEKARTEKLFLDAIEVEVDEVDLKFAPLECLCLTGDTFEIVQILVSTADPVYLRTNKPLDIGWIEDQLRRVCKDESRYKEWRKLVRQYRSG